MMNEQNYTESNQDTVKIFEINGERVMFEYDVAEFFKTTVEEVLKVYKQNPDRFPDDFTYQLTHREFEMLCNDFPNSNLKKQDYIPLGFTDCGMAMLSAYLNTNEALDYHVAVIRMFNDLNKASSEAMALEQRLNSIEMQMAQQFEAMNQTLDNMCKANNLQRNPIGFKSKK